MNTVKTRIRISPDGTFTGQVKELPVGEHEAQIVLLDSNHSAMAEPKRVLAAVQLLQDEIWNLKILDRREPDEIIGYNDRGHLD
jgi:hypothetical protein